VRALSCAADSAGWFISSTGADRGGAVGTYEPRDGLEMWTAYRLLPSLRGYMLVAQGDPPLRFTPLAQVG